MARDYTMKVANMKKPQDFTLYPYSGGEQIMLQSDKRFAIVNLKTGHGIIDSKNHNYPNTVTVQMSNIKFELPKETRDAIIKHLTENNGKSGNVAGMMFFDNEKLSETIS